MKKIVIDESNMRFGPYNEEDIFQIEKSSLYAELSDKVKITEFILVKTSQKINIIEAKSSSPQPEKKVDYKTFIREIYEKFVNTFSLTLALVLKRFPSEYETLPGNLKNIDVSKVKCIFILVIHGHEEKWLPPIQDSLNQLLYPFLKTWALDSASVIVMNDEIARRKKLIQ